MKISAVALAAILGLAACGQGQSAAENTADALENAAEQSTPEAAAILENEADRIRDQNVTAPLDAPGSPAQEALQAAGNAQVRTKQTVPAPPPPQPKTPDTPPKAAANEIDHNGH
jgi:hypothetical protein